MTTKMTPQQALQSMCEHCEIWMGKNQTACPFRSISGDYCDEYETLKEAVDLITIIDKPTTSVFYSPQTARLNIYTRQINGTEAHKFIQKYKRG